MRPRGSQIASTNNRMRPGACQLAAQSSGKAAQGCQTAPELGVEIADLGVIARARSARLGRIHQVGR